MLVATEVSYLATILYTVYYIIHSTRGIENRRKIGNNNYRLFATLQN